MAIVSTGGNDECHLILRGGADSTNYDAASVKAAIALLNKAQVPHQASHRRAQVSPQKGLPPQGCKCPTRPCPSLPR